MNMRTSRSTVAFSYAFGLSGYPDALPAGEYEIVVEEERLQGLSFEAYRRTETYLVVRGTGHHAGRTEMRYHRTRPGIGFGPGSGRDVER